MKALLIALALTLTLPATSFADVDCSDVRSENRDECIRAKRGGDRDIDINCSDVKNKNRDECLEARHGDRKDDFDKDDVECRNADDPDVRRECLKRKY